MTKKHSIALADAIRPLDPFNQDWATDSGNPPGSIVGFWNDTVDALADFCQSQNPQFDREQWLDYIDGNCGPNGGKE